MKRVAIVDYGINNLFSIHHGFTHIGADSFISESPEEFMNADALCLPGVGAFSKAMENLEKLDLISPLREYVSTGKPVLGICLGMQLLFTESEEFGTHKGMGLFSGTVRQMSGMDNDKPLRVPQIGWNQLSHSKENRSWEGTPLSSTTEEDYFYFVHSLHVDVENESDVLARTTYGNLSFCSAVSKENLTAFQFHPEKSGPKGLQLLKNWFEQQ